MYKDVALFSERQILMCSEATDPSQDTPSPQTESVDLEFLRRAIETSMHAVLICSLDLSIEWVNSEFLRKFNLDNIVAAKKLSVRSLLETPENIEVPMQELMETGRWQGELRLRRSENSLIDVLLTATILPDTAGDPWKIIISGMDITEEKQAEEVFARKSMLLDSILQSASDAAIATTDLDLHITYYNAMAEKFFGYTAEEVIGRTVMEMHLKEKVDPERLERAIEIVRKTGEYCYSITQETADGPRYLDSRVAGIFNSDGKLVGFSLFSRDVTEHKRADEALQESRERYRNLVESITDLVWAVDLNGVHTFSNEAVKKLLGFEVNEVIGQSAFPMMHPEDQEAMKEMVAESIEQKKGWRNVNLRLLHKKGSVHLFESSAQPLFDAEGNLLGFTGIDRDITERKQADEILRKSEERFRQVTDNAQEWIWEVDCHGLYTYGSPVVEKILGYKPEEIVGHKHFYDLFHPDDREELKKTALQAFSGKQAFSEFVNRNLHKNGEVVWLSTSGAPILDKNGNLLGYRGADTDITERKRADEALLESQEIYRNLVDKMAEGVVSTDEYENLTYANNAAAEIFGYSKEELLQLNLKDLTSTEEYKRVLEQTSIRKSNVSSVYELDIIRKDRNLRTISVNAIPIISTDGEFRGTYGIFSDITERREAEKALLESENSLRTLFNSMTDIVFEMDYDGRYINIAPTSPELMFKPSEDIIGKTLHEVFPEPEADRFLGFIRKCLDENKINTIEYPLSIEDRIIWFEGRATPKTGNTALYIARDITERKQLEEQVRQRLIALTQPEVDLGDLSLTDIVGVDMLQRLQDAFADAFNMPTIIYGSDGAAITKPSHFTSFCDLVRSTEEGAARCEAFDSELMNDLRENRKPRIRCSCALSNIVTGTVPILIQDQHLANWSIGQMVNPELDLREVRSFAKQIGLDEKELVEAAKTLIPVDDESLERAVAFLNTLSDQISLLALQNLQQGRDIAARREAEEERLRLLHNMGERVKELRCMYGIAESIRTLETLEQIFEKAVTLIPLAWQYPEIARSRIRFDDQEFVSQPFKETQWQQSANIVIAGEPRGTVEVFYLEERSEQDEGLFLVEERNLIDGIGRALSEAIERKHAQRERFRLMSAIEQAAETVVITDAEGNIQYVNPAFESITGYSRKEVIGQNPRILKSGRHDEIFYRKMWETLERGETWSGRLVNRKKDSTLYTEEVTVSPVHDSSGETVNYVAVKRDITEEIRLENQLRQALKMEAVGQLAGGVAHDFNNLLQVINGYAEMALSRIESSHPSYGSVKEVARAGDRASILVNQLLSFSRRQIINPVDLDLNEVIFNLLKMIRRVIGEHIECDFIPGHGLGTIHADRGQMEQVLMNLCVNARDAMPVGGTITIETRNALIDGGYIKTHPFAKPGRYVLLSITDSGCGMDEETLSNVFDPFFTTKEVGKGTGLGLSTVYGIIKQHDGDIQVYSEIDKGTIFKIYMSAVEHRASKVSSTIPGPAVGGTETILVAEDDEMVRNLTVQTLENAGYTVLDARDGEEALRLFEAHTDEIDLTMLDVVMPGLGGRDVHDRIKEIHPGTKVLFSSGYSQNAIHTSFILDEGLQLIQKPYGADALIRRVREVLDS